MREYNYCLRCGKKLVSQENRERGYGKTCWEKSLALKTRRPLFDKELDMNEFGEMLEKNKDIVLNKTKSGVKLVVCKSPDKYAKNPILCLMSPTGDKLRLAPFTDVRSAISLCEHFKNLEDK